MWVFDATPLIYLAKAGRLTLVDRLDERCCIPERVYTEVVTTGIEHGHPDARRIERCVEDDLFEVVSVEQTPLDARLQQNPNLSDADVAVLVAAAESEGTAVMDEQYGRDVAATEDITTRGTAFLLLMLVKRGAVSEDEARKTIDTMIDEGWYCAPDLYAKIVQKLQSFS